MVEKFRPWIQRLQHFADRAWYFPVLGFLAGLDLFIFVVPTDALLISSVFLQPRRWVSAFLWISLGSSIASVALAALIQWDANLVMEHWFPQAFDSSLWLMVDNFFDDHGHIALVLLAFSPLAQFPIVAVAALSGMPLTQLFFSVLLGRMAKAFLLAWGASHAPKLLMRLPFLRREVTSLHSSPPSHI